jgi:hypothetical protein
MDTISAQEALERAQQELERTRAKVNEEHRAQLVEQLRQVREELRTTRARHQQLTARIHIEREDIWNKQAQITHALDLLGDSHRARPAAADYLPDDVEVVVWRKAHDDLQAKYDQLVRERSKLPDPEQTIIQSNNDAMLIQRLAFSEANLLRALSGQGGIVRIEGSVSGVR